MFSCFKDTDFLKRFLKISLPVMMAAFVTFLVTFVDNIMVGSISNEAVSGVYAANEITFVFEISAFGIMEGAGIFLQQFNGIKDKEHIKQCFRYKLIFSLLFLLVFIPLIFFFGKNIIYIFCQKDTNSELILKEGVDYLNLILLSYIPYVFGQIYCTSLREIGETKYAMYSSFSAIIANVLFNSLFIFGFQMGVKGAAIATIISRIIEMFFFIFFSHYKKMSYAYGVYQTMKIEKPLFIEINKKTWILFINEVGWSIGMILQSLAYSQRDGVLSAISIVTTVNNILQILFNGLSIGIGVMVGSSLGRKDFDKAKDEAKKLILSGFYSAIIIGILLLILSPFIPQLYGKVDPLQKGLATELIIIVSVFLFARTLCASIYYILKAGGNSGITFFYDTGLMLLLYIPISWSLALFTSIDVKFIYLIICIIDLGKATFGLILMKKFNWARNLTTLKKDE